MKRVALEHNKTRRRRCGLIDALRKEISKISLRMEPPGKRKSGTIGKNFEKNDGKRDGKIPDSAGIACKRRRKTKLEVIYYHPMPCWKFWIIHTYIV